MNRTIFRVAQEKKTSQKYLILTKIKVIKNQPDVKSRTWTYRMLKVLPPWKLIGLPGYSMVPDVKIYPRISGAKKSNYTLPYISPVSESHYQCLQKCLCCKYYRCYFRKKLWLQRSFSSDEKALIYINSIKVEKKINILLMCLTCLLILAFLFHTVLMFFHYKSP